MCNRFRLALIALSSSILIALSTVDLLAQRESVRPDINTSFQSPDVSQFVERFEREGREVYDNRHEIIAACKIKPGSAVADIGAGTGLFTRLLASQVGLKGHVIAVDIAKEFVEHIERTCREDNIKNVSTVICTQSSAQLPTNSIDLAFLCDVYHHFEFPYKTIRSIHRALKPDGQLILIDFHRIQGKSSDWIMGHVRAGRETFVSEVETMGFEIAEEPALFETSYFIRFKKSNRRTASGHTVDSHATVQRLMDVGEAILIDVREQNEWDDGHLDSAKLVPLSRLTALASDSAKLKTWTSNVLPRDKIVYCHCRSGGRVLRAAKVLEPLGFDIRPLSSGFTALVREGFAEAN